MRGRGNTHLVLPLYSPLSPIIFLILMVPIIRKIEKVIKKVASYDNELPLYINDLHVNIFNWNRIYIDMKLLLKRIDKVVN